MCCEFGCAAPLFKAEIDSGWTRMSKRRFLAIAIVAVVVVGGAAAVWSQIQRPAADAPRPRRLCRRRAGAGDRGGHRAAPTCRSISTASAPSARSTPSRCARRSKASSSSVAFKEGQDVKRGQVLARIDPTTYQAQLDQAIAKKAQDEATLANARLDLERYTRLVAIELRRAPAARHPEGDGGAARGAGEARSGGDRQRQGDPAIHHHHRAARRPHRHPAGRRGQHRARLGCHRHRRHHPASADLGPVHAAAAAARRRHPRLGQGRAGRSRRSAPTTRR